jgi:hypothetical protein
MKRIALLVLPVILLLSACALEIANVIGPGGGYVYYDKGNYKDGWRYKECSPFDIGELKNTDPASLIRAVELCIAQTDDWYAYDWEIPDEADMKKILECFSYGLTRFSPDYYYLAANNQPVQKDKQPKYKKPPEDPEDAMSEDDLYNWKLNAWKLDKWDVVILHKNFDNKANGEVEKVDAVPAPFTIRVRPIRKF